MATFEEGISGPFRGKVGSVIGYKWKGIPVMRSLPRRSTKPKTPKQLANQQKMGLMQALLKTVKPFTDRGFTPWANKSGRMSAFNAAMSYNKKNAIKGEYPDLEIDFERFRFSQGDLNPPQNLLVQILPDSSIELTWSTDADGEADDDQLMVMLYDPKYNTLEGELSGPKRKTGRAVVDALYSDSPGEHLYHCYAAFISDDREDVSDSVYVGAIFV